jgi:hypothetical protein
VIFISHFMAIVYIFKTVNLFYFTKVRMWFRVCLGGVHAFKFKLHNNDLGFPFIPLIELDLFQEFLSRKTYTQTGHKKAHTCTRYNNYTAAQKFNS